MRTTSSTNHSSSSSSRTDKPKHVAVMLDGDDPRPEKQGMVKVQEEKKRKKRSTATLAFANSETITSPIKKQKTALLTRKPKCLIHSSSNNDGRSVNGGSGATAAKSKLTGAPKPQQKLSTSQKRATERLRQRKA
ncbi:hypothetical protein DIS24_g3560 [Lasiodiplodia hormozganensis]|uniref:Uncharacterized protein n=1 Tax=Lasiodiplodia hormozganensis TaxID=869390 RepID=A0AA39YWU1_9PEZI|nr:hypothetical protein DIS24_g3560 [Lasiodiplodia hormozganensis]